MGVVGGGRGVAFFWEMGNVRYFCFVRKSKSRDEKISLDSKLFFHINVTEAHLLFSPKPLHRLTVSHSVNVVTCTTAST